MSDYPNNLYTPETDPDKKAKRSWQSIFLGSPVLLISILAHILFGIIAALLIVQRIEEKRKQNFTELSVSQPSAAAAAAKQKTSVKNALSNMSVPDVVHSITVADLSSVSLPDVSIPQESAPAGGGKLDGTAMAGEGMSSGVGQGAAGLPDVSMDIDPATIAGTAFGVQQGGQGLKGRFYDLKQTNNRMPTGMTVENYGRTVADFLDSGWPDDYFKKYFICPKPLYLPQMYIPLMPASLGPKAYKVDDLVQPKMWIAVYKGSFTPSSGGRYRFVGYADDVLDVAINHTTVLEGNLHYPTSPHSYVKNPSKNFYKYNFPVVFPPDGPTAGPYINGAHMPLAIGDWFLLKAGQTVPIEIIIGEQPGGQFGAWLLVEKEGETYDKTPEGSPILPMFKISDKKLPPADQNSPPYDHKADLGWAASDPDADTDSGTEANQSIAN